MRITYHPDAEGVDAYEVVSDSGSTYTVRYCGSGDGDPEYVALWECNCPAGRHGRDCKHRRAVCAVADDDPLPAGTVLRDDAHPELVAGRN